MQSWLIDILACPRDRTKLHVEGSHLCCVHGHKYRVVNSIPVFLLPERDQTIPIAAASSIAAETMTGSPLYLDTLGISEGEKRGVEKEWSSPFRKIDPAISYLIGATSGYGYAALVGKLDSYPIPNIPVGNGWGELLLDVGSNWGRWSVSAARKGWKVVGIEPSLGAIMAARRAFSDCADQMCFVCGDARFLPFKTNTFRCAFSYSVIQHFSETDAKLAISEIGRVLKTRGYAKIQLAHEGGIRATYHRTRTQYKDAGVFRVRYWSLAMMRDAFEQSIGRTQIIAEAFGGLGLLKEDRKYVSVKAKMVIAISSLMRSLSIVATALIRLADSVYVVSIKP